MADVWVEATDPKSAKKYYYNKKTKKTQWQRPPELDGQEKEEDDLDEENIPTNWVEVKDPKSGKPYYYNKITRSTNWDRPPCLDPETTNPNNKPAKKKPEEQAQGNSRHLWRQATDPKSGKPYWYNKATKETTWKNPFPDDDDDEPSSPKSPKGGGLELEDLDAIRKRTKSSTPLPPPDEKEDFSLVLKDLTPLPSEVAEVKKRILGKGAFGTVYKASYQFMPVAVKVINHAQEFSKEAKEEIQKECGIMKKLHHVNVGRLFGLSLDDENACIVLELAELGSLYQILQNGEKYPDLPWSKRVGIALDIAKGINCLHSRNPPVLHRDLKSLNAMIRENWSAFIVDFGLSKVKIESQSKGSKGVGSYPWMAPEMLDDDAISTLALDVYSFGMILFELLTRDIPFKGWSFQKVSRALDRGERPEIPFPSRCPSTKDCPHGYVNLMKDCWHQDPNKRPMMAQVISRLITIQKEVPGSPSSPSPPSSSSSFDSSILGMIGAQVESSLFTVTKKEDREDILEWSNNLGLADIAPGLQKLELRRPKDIARLSTEELDELCKELNLKFGRKLKFMDAVKELQAR